MNNGTCNEQADGFNCTCPLGFAGDRCQDGKNRFRMGFDLLLTRKFRSWDIYDNNNNSIYYLYGAN